MTDNAFTAVDTILHMVDYGWKWPGCGNGKMRKCRNAKLESSCATQPESVGGCLAWINTGNPDHSISTTYCHILPTTYIYLHLFFDNYI